MGYNGIISKIVSEKKKLHKLIIFNFLETCQCDICHEFLSVPMMISCGHNYCYRCIKNWFLSNATRELNCPSCRESVINEPCLNLMIEQNMKSLFDLLKKRKKKMFKTDSDKKELDELLRERFDDAYYYKKDKDDGNMYDGVFKNSAIAVQDLDDDGIPRCSNCHWELEPEDMEDENVCPHCHARIRNNTSNLSTNRSIALGGNSRPPNPEDYSEGEYDQIVSEIRNYNPSDMDSDGSSESVGYSHEEDNVKEEGEEEHDSELDSFIADDDDEGDLGQSSDNEKKRKYTVVREEGEEEGKDSDYYEHNDDEGFVSGDSLDEPNDSQPIDLETLLDDDDLEQVNLDSDDDDNEEDDVGSSAKRQRRTQMILSDED